MTEPSKPRQALVELLLRVYFTIAFVHLVAQALSHKALSDVTQGVVLLPLMGWLLAASPKPVSHLTRFAFVGLFFSWLGDTVPRFLEGATGFWWMVGLFFIGQLAYVAALWPQRGRSLMGGKRTLGIVLLLLSFGVMGLGQSALGIQAAVVVAYATAILSMALLATALGPPGLAGGLLFVVSDAMIALRAFGGLEIPLGGVWVMLTYLLAQLCLARGFVVLANEAQVAPSASNLEPSTPGSWSGR